MSPPNSELYSIITTHMQPNMLCQASHNPVSFLLFIFWDITHYTTQAAQPCLEHKQCTLHINLSMVKPMQRNHIAPLYMLTPAYTSVKPTRTMVPTQSQCHYNTFNQANSCEHAPQRGNTTSYSTKHLDQLMSCLFHSHRLVWLAWVQDATTCSQTSQG